MPTLSGIYTSLTGQTLAIDEHGHLRIIDNDKQKTKLRADAEFWLCEDDGKIGKFGSPKKVPLPCMFWLANDWDYPLLTCFHRSLYTSRTKITTSGWNRAGLATVLTRHYGLIPIEPNGQYSNQFLALKEGNQLEILQSWSDAAKFRCVE
ncbi:hypothetical protein BDV40DRAFT_302246 [Aspergillus tamarii]|uniref:Uncharacterized protein n=1 Tax=Aspergillus tamarii TaxID=41984 RepID=A0A5N6UP60_ASPTM|nr:hypothetical protein BDV40DRAFT_302246 [Aspergillus tamarii]